MFLSIPTYIASLWKTSTRTSPESETDLLPLGAFDTHVNVFDPTRDPNADVGECRLNDAPVQRILEFSKSLSEDDITRKIVLVQSTPHKSDCMLLLHCLSELERNGRTAYGIVVIDADNISDDELWNMHELGVRGIQLSFEADGKSPGRWELASILRRAAQRICNVPGWMIQLYVPTWVWDELYGCIMSLPVTVIADHLGGALGESKLLSEFKSTPLSQPGFQALISLARKKMVVIKVSGLYRGSTKAASNFNDMRPIVQTLVREVPEQLILGSDWPHTGNSGDQSKKLCSEVKGPAPVFESVRMLQHLREWVGDERAWQQLLKQNPERLYEFDQFISV